METARQEGHHARRITVRPCTTADIPAIRAVTMAVWPATYVPIIGEQQVAYMLEMMYAPAALTEQLTTRGHTFFLAEEDGRPVGFASCSPQDEGARLHKLYVLPDQQGKGTGSKLMDAVHTHARSFGAPWIELNVNRHNRAKGFYEKLGFVVHREEDIDIGGGFFMNDYVMRKAL